MSRNRHSNGRRNGIGRDTDKLAKKRSGKCAAKPLLDFSKASPQVEIAQPKPVVLTKDAWAILRDRCREMNDDEFTIVSSNRRIIEFNLVDRDGKPQRYRIRAELLKRTSAQSGKKLYALFLLFEKDGVDVVDTAQFWFEPFKLWLKFWAGKGLNPRELREAPTNSVGKAISIDEQIGGYKKRFSS